MRPPKISGVEMPFVLPVTLALALASAQAATTQNATPLSAHLPAGALLTLETRNAGPAIDRLAGLVAGVLEDAGLDEEGPGEMLAGVSELLKDSVGRESVVGVFTVGRSGGRFSPEVLAVVRAGQASAGIVKAMLPGGKGARVGNYTFGRADDLFVGQSAGLVYASTDKALLMSYLGRLSGKTGPRLNTSVAYTTPTRPLGSQELSLYANFSAAAKVVRSEFARLGLPRLLSPLVDGLDTLGQYAGGLTTTAQGLTTRSAHAVNRQGKDQPLARLLTDTTDFAVQDILPANVEAVQASACAPEQGAYLGRWLTRLDLLEPFGFLTDSQLASHLERSGHYLGHECAQVALAGATQASLNAEDPLASLRRTVSYRRVTDQAAAQAHMPEYAASLNAAIGGLRSTLGTGLNGAVKGMLNRDEMNGLGPTGMVGLGAAMGGIQEVDQLLRDLKLVYGFRDGYLVTAWSDEALRAALDSSASTLGQRPAFQAADLNLSGVAGWRYQPDPADLTAEDLLGAMPEDLKDEELDGLFGVVAEGAARLINRYGGMSAQRSVQGNVILGKANVSYDW
ncbi:hypothetical protein [Deinococcus navajonensis]|uniref:Uncharacterized protein n=1 Tax=Deinococcus navajonensis TaxID=309884 RepID=A0ABV8XMN2_9DEIO